MCANLLADLVWPRELVCAGLTARLTAPSPPVWSAKRKGKVLLFTYKEVGAPTVPLIFILNSGE
jgi:hypothetical protein